MSWFRKHCFEWQTSWFNWGLSVTDVPDDHFKVTKRYCIVGPLQMRWWK